MNINEDLLYRDNLQGKKYMMGVSPYSIEEELVLFERVSLA